MEYNCHTCGKQFKWKLQLERHMMDHSGVIRLTWKIHIISFFWFPRWGLFHVINATWLLSAVMDSKATSCLCTVIWSTLYVNTVAVVSAPAQESVDTRKTTDVLGWKLLLQVIGRDRYQAMVMMHAWNFIKYEIMRPWLQVLSPRVTITQLPSIVLWRKRRRWLCQMWAGRV